MAIQDRNLSVGTKLYARYKGQTHTAEVVLNPEATGERPIAYKVEGKDELFKSPSAAGTAVTEKACNGWAFWSVGDGAEKHRAGDEHQRATASQVDLDHHAGTQAAGQAPGAQGPEPGGASERRAGRGGRATRWRRPGWQPGP